jgi:hypothetical protein
MIEKKIKIDEETIDLLLALQSSYLDYDNQNFAKWHDVEDVSLPLTFCIKYNFATLTEKGEKSILDCYNHLVDFANSLELDSMDSLLDYEEEIPPRTIIIKL